MLIAKSFYGKKAKQGIERLEEGKYRISGKIVFVRVSRLNDLLTNRLRPYFLQLLRDRHVMVRVGGGWDTLEHFLSRHGAELEVPPEISPSDLLPMDTRPSESRRRDSMTSITSPNTSVHNGSLLTLNSSIGTTVPSQSPSTTELSQLRITTVHAPQKIMNRSPSVSHLPVLRRCISSTPVSRPLSRRSSIASSSPEPWGHIENGISKIPRRYINYLSSSQHISTSRSSLSGSTMTLASQPIDPKSPNKSSPQDKDTLA